MNSHHRNLTCAIRMEKVIKFGDDMKQLVKIVLKIKRIKEK